MEIEFGVQKFSLLWCEAFGFMPVFFALPVQIIPDATDPCVRVLRIERGNIPRTVSVANVMTGPAAHDRVISWHTQI